MFLVLSVVGAVLAVATPVLAGRVVDAIDTGGPPGVVVGLAVLIAVIAVAEAGLGVLTRWFSARIGEDLILDLRAAVFSHVQRMPVAFFTRTRTGALVSRLNNDVIGAQRAFSDTLSGVVGNVVTLALALGVMLTLSWQVTLLALVLLPVFVLPARRIGRRLARLEREAADHNAAMGNQMTERFSAPGATLVKLFGRPADESREFVARAARVRDIGVRTAMVQWVFVTALTLVSALALALVYGLGGLLALNGRMAAGDVVALALLITRLYAPLTALAGARVEVMTALVSFGRVFEILDLPPLIREPRAARARCRTGRCRSSSSHVRFAYPAATAVSLASLEDVARLDDRGGGRGAARRVVPRRAGADGGAGRLVGGRQVDRSPSCCPGSTTSTPARCGSAGWTCASCRSTRSAARSGLVTQDGHLFHESIRSNLLLARPEATEARAVGRAAAGPAR